ncbi:MAG: alpha/beta hydrolase [Leptospiraceae bacterium]
MKARRAHWVFLRGLGRQSGHWFLFRRLLENQSRYPFNGTLHFPDLPGTGLRNQERSPARISAITEDLRSRTVVGLPQNEIRCLFAISLGGMVALDWLNRHPGDFDFAFIVNSSLKGLSPVYQRMRPGAMVDLASGIFQGLVRKDIQSMESRVFARSCNRSNPDGLQNWIDLQSHYPVRFSNFSRQLLAAMRFKSPNPDFNSPIFLVSRKDRLVDPRCSDALFRKYGSPGKYFVHPTAGHDLTTDDPEGTVDFLSLYLRQNS